MKVKPDLSFWKLWNISFGFFGVQIRICFAKRKYQPHFFHITELIRTAKISGYYRRWQAS